MKRIVLILFFMLFSFSANAQNNINCINQTPNKNFVGVLKSSTGINLLTKNIIEHELKKALKKEVGADFKVNVKNYWGVNLLDGYFKGIDVKADKLTFNDISLSDFSVKTACTYNKVELKEDKIIFPQDLVLEYSAKITQEGLNNYINSSKYKKIIDKINQDKIISSLFKVELSNLEIQNDKLVFKTIIKQPTFGLSAKANLSARLKLIDGQIELCDININSKKISKNTIMPIIERLNPFNYGVKIDETNEGKLELKNIEIKNSEILVNGLMTIYQNN